MKRKQLSSGRILTVSICAVVLWSISVARLIQVQILEHSQAVELAERQVEGWVTIPAVRGLIVDAQGSILATNKECVTFAAVPKRWKTQSARLRAARRLASVSGQSAKEWLKRFQESPEFVYVARHADPDVARKIAGWDDDAIFAISEAGRMYPARETARELLGKVDIDNRGLAGIEMACEKYLAGTSARGRVRYDARREASIDPLPASLAVDGADVQLTLDRGWQEIVERELDALLERTGAKGAGAIFMTPQGAIRALAYRVNPEREDAAAETVSRCRPVTDLYEPGSTFKAMIASALLTEKKVTLTDSVYADSGRALFGDRWINDSEPHLWLSFAESFVVSSNIAFGKWAQRIDGEDIYRWARDFGFGTATGIGLGAEPDGVVPSYHRWNELRLAQIAMGHSISVTPLQMVSAFAAFATGGDLYKPYVVQSVLGPDGDTVSTTKPEKIRHLLSPQIVETMRELLARVVSEGTAKPAVSKAIAIAGKTGTAQKVREDGLGYYRDKFISSFVGFFPVDAPQVVGIVYVDEPKRFHWGGWCAGPTFRDIAERLAAMHPEFLRSPVVDPTGEMPPPRPDPELTPGVVPDLEGLPLARAIALASQLGYIAEINGTGCVKSQFPRPGESMRPGGTITLHAVPAAPCNVAGLDRDESPGREGA